MGCSSFCFLAVSWNDNRIKKVVYLFLYSHKQVCYEKAFPFVITVAPGDDGAGDVEIFGGDGAGGGW